MYSKEIEKKQKREEKAAYLFKRRWSYFRETPNCPLKKFETKKIDPASRLHEHLA